MLVIWGPTGVPQDGRTMAELNVGVVAFCLVTTVWRGRLMDT
jgi:hypothetical protein